MATVDEVAASSPVSRATLGREAWRGLSRGDRVALIAFGIVFLGSFIAPLFAPHSPSTPITAPFGSPGPGTLLGTDDVGRDLFSRILYGARESWIGALVVIAIGASFGTAVGLIAGAVGGWVDSVLMRTTDAFLALPAPMLAIAIAAALGSSFRNALLAVVIVWWPLYARLVRGQVKALASRPHVEAARLGGVSTRRIWLRHLLPGALPPVIIAASLDVGGLVLVLASLSFLGLGSADPATELGTMTSRGLPYLLSSPGVSLFPALAVFIIAFVSNVAGDAARNLFVSE